MGLNCCVKSYCAITLSIFGILALIVGIGALLYIPKFIGRQISERDHLGLDQDGKDNVVLKMYRDPPYDVKMQIWIVSVQNPREIVEKGEKPRVTEIGPYTYDIRLHKTNVTFSANKTHLFYRNVKTFLYNAEKSCKSCKLTDKVTVPNVVFQKIVDVLAENPTWKLFIEPFLKGMENIFVTVTVDELLFKGYKDKLISQICENPLLKTFCDSNSVPDRIGLFYGQNNTDDGIYEVNTGSANVNLIGRVHSWNGMQMLNGTHWYGVPARMIRGTDAQLFPPNLYGVQKLEIFFGQLCRSFDLEFRQTATVSDLPVRRFVQPDSLLRVDTQREQGFCNPNSVDYFNNQSIQKVGCAPSGLLDMSSCLPGQPRIFLSNAHFRNASDGLRQSIVGLPPESDDDIFGYFDIEPLTGVAVHVQQRFQLNLGMLKGDLRMTRNMRNMIMPMIWMNQVAMVDPNTKRTLLLPLTILHYSFIGGIVLTVIGTILLICSLILATIFVINYNRRKSRSKNATGLPRLNNVRHLNGTILTNGNVE